MVDTRCSTKCGKCQRIVNANVAASVAGLLTGCVVQNKCVCVTGMCSTRVFVRIRGAYTLHLGDLFTTVIIKI